MQVTALRLVNFGKIRARVDIKTSEGFTIKGFKVIEGENGYFVGMPSERTKSGKYIDIVQISDPMLKEMVESLVMDAYEAKLNKQDAAPDQE